MSQFENFCVTVRPLGYLLEKGVEFHPPSSRVELCTFYLSFKIFETNLNSLFKHLPVLVGERVKIF